MCSVYKPTCSSCSQSCLLDGSSAPNTHAAAHSEADEALLQQPDGTRTWAVYWDMFCTKWVSMEENMALLGWWFQDAKAQAMLLMFWGWNWLPRLTTCSRPGFRV